jgi:hypothetical protein
MVGGLDTAAIEGRYALFEQTMEPTIKPWRESWSSAQAHSHFFEDGDADLDLYPARKRKRAKGNAAALKRLGLIPFIAGSVQVRVISS